MGSTVFNLTTLKKSLTRVHHFIRRIFFEKEIGKIVRKTQIKKNLCNFGNALENISLFFRYICNHHKQKL